MYIFQMNRYSKLNLTLLSLFKPKGYPISFILNVIKKFKNKFNSHYRQFPADSLNNNTNFNSYLILLCIGIPFIKFGKSIAAMFRDRLGTDIEINL